MAAKKKKPPKKVTKRPAKKPAVAKKAAPQRIRVTKSVAVPTLIAPAPVPVVVAQYRKRMGDATWHLTTLCPNWPNNDYVVRSERPTDSLCGLCVTLTGG